jgi:RNAse (barnase) inhibitor barstar
MSKLVRVLAQEHIPGVYRFRSKASVEFLQKEASKNGWRLFYLDGAKIRDKKTLLDHMARAMDFPDYFGKNWDALNDCLTDLERATGYIVLFDAPDRFMQNSPADWDVALDVFNTAIEFWREQGIPFYVLLRGSSTLPFPQL